MVLVYCKKRCLSTLWYFLSTASIASTSLFSSSSIWTSVIYFCSWINFSRKPSSLIWAYPIWPLSKFTIYNYFLTLCFFFSSSICFFAYCYFFYSSSCFRFSTILCNDFVKFSGPLSLWIMLVAWECTLLFLIREDSYIPASTFCLYSSAYSFCSFFGTSNFLIKISSNFLLPILWLCSFR